MAVLRQRYVELSRAAGLKTQHERTEIAGVGEKTLAKQAESGIMRPNGPKEIPEVRKEGTPRRPLAVMDVTEGYLSTTAPGQGLITYDDGYDMQRNQAEVNFSKWLHKTFGGDIRLLTEANQHKVTTPDYLWRGKLWDLKTATTEKSANSALRHGLKQIFGNPGGIILDYRGQKIDLTVLDEVIRKRLWWFENHPSLDVMVVLGESEVKVWRYPQKT